jgi:hypothetical protein
MPLRNSKPAVHKPKGVVDSVDGTNAPPGSMSALGNLIPNPTTADQWVPRPPSTVMTTAFPGIGTPGQGSALLVVGDIIYGMIAATSGIYAGKDVPFAYNWRTNTYQTITIPGGAASLPTTQPTLGAWTPPTMAVVGTRIIITHPGYGGAMTGYFFGWLDLTGFSSATITGNTHGTTTLDTLSANVLQAGWQVGMTITDSAGDIPANTTIVSIASPGGLSVVLSNAATGSHAGTTITAAGGTLTAPLYGAGNTNGNALPSVPVSASQFNARAYYAVGNGVVLSDAGSPTQVTSATQALSFSNGLPTTALAGLPLSQLLGGVLQALVAFQGDATLQQITGDPTTQNLSVNAIGVGVGTVAPNTIAVTPSGLAFVAPDGLRFLTFTGTLTDPVGGKGDGIVNPFLNSVVPSRMCAAYNQDVLRISVQNGVAVGQPTQEWWYHISRKVWTGPHTFPAALIEGRQGAGADNDFVLFATGIPGKIWESDVLPVVILGTFFIENGLQMTFDFETVLLPDTGGMCENSMTRTTLAAAISRNDTWTVIASDEQDNTLDQAYLIGPSLADTIWGSFIWGMAPWSGPGTFFVQHRIPWHLAIVFKQMVLSVTGNCNIGTVLGNFYLEIAELGYLTQYPYPPPVPPVPAEVILTTDSGIPLTGDDGVTILLSDV